MDRFFPEIEKISVRRLRFFRAFSDIPVFSDGYTFSYAVHPLFSTFSETGKSTDSPMGFAHFPQSFPQIIGFSTHKRK
jgi:hypothetical protein